MITIAQLYKVTHLPTNLTYYGSVWAKDKTIYDRLQDHVTHGGSKYISEMVTAGAIVSEFTTELLAIGEVTYICEIESKLSATNLWPSGLNGNAGKNIVRTKEGQKKVSDAVSKAKLGKTKETSAGVASQAKKAAEQCGDNRTEKQRLWDAQKSQINKSNGNSPPLHDVGSKMMNDGTVTIFVSPSQIQHLLENNWVFGKLGDFSMSEETKKKLRKPKEKITCPHCGLTGGSSQMKRWHYDNCKSK